VVFLCNTVGNDYVYDANKNITNIQYNYLNLPTQVTINGQHIMYTYDATGTKLRKTVNGVTTDYAKGGALKKQFATVFSERASWRVAYENNVLQFFSQPEGYFEPSSPPSGELVGAYVYQYKDHLGNIRLSYSDKNNDGIILASSDPNTNEIVEENNYYPFGLEHKGYNANINGRHHKYMFGGKEQQDELGLNWYDITDRNYDPALGRWMNLDPLAEKMRRHSPYNYAFDNPIFFIDADGMSPIASLRNGEQLSQKSIDNSAFGGNQISGGAAYSVAAGRAPGEYDVDKNTGQIQKVSDKGGDKTDYFNVGTTNSEGKFVTDQTITTERGTGTINSFRFTDTDQSTTSAFIIPQAGGKDITGFFLEPAGPSTSVANQDKRIPEGTFNIENYSSDKYPSNFRLYNSDVSKSRKILLHTGNYPSNTEGCLLCGKSFKKNFVGSSVNKFGEIKGFLNSTGAENVKFNIFNVIPDEGKK